MPFAGCVKIIKKQKKEKTKTTKKRNDKRNLSGEGEERGCGKHTLYTLYPLLPPLISRSPGEGAWGAVAKHLYTCMPVQPTLLPLGPQPTLSLPQFWGVILFGWEGLDGKGPSDGAERGPQPPGGELLVVGSVDCRCGGKGPPPTSKCLSLRGPTPSSVGAGHRPPCWLRAPRPFSRAARPSGPAWPAGRRRSAPPREPQCALWSSPP